MKYCHYVKLSVFAKISEGEDEKNIKGSIIELSGIDLEKEKLKIGQQTASGFNEKKIRIFEIEVVKDRHINTFLEQLMKHLDKKQKELLLKQIESRLDVENNFFIRLDKDKLIDREYVIVDHGDCFHIKMSIAAFPTNRENAKKVVKEIIGL